MAEGVLVNNVMDPKALIAEVRCEKVGARESQIIEADVRIKAASRLWRIVVDMKDVTMLASMGLGMLVNLHKSCAKEGGKMVVCNISADIMQVLKITHLDRVLKIVADRDAAMKAVG